MAAEKMRKESRELMKTGPMRPMSAFEEMERRFDEFFRRPFSMLGPSWWPGPLMPAHEEVAPSVDIFEEGNDVVVKAELPGMSKEEISVKLTEDGITISGEKKKEEKVEKKNYYRLERSFGSFTRSFRLPSGVQTEKAKAHFKDGVLEIKLPKSEAALKKEKKVEIE